MNLLKNFFTFLLLVGFYIPSYAAVNSIEIDSCAVFSEADDEKGDKKEGGEKEEEEEPDCE